MFISVKDDSHNQTFPSGTDYVAVNVKGTTKWTPPDDDVVLVVSQVHLTLPADESQWPTWYKFQLVQFRPANDPRGALDTTGTSGPIAIPDPQPAGSIRGDFKSMQCVWMWPHTVDDAVPISVMFRHNGPASLVSPLRQFKLISLAA